MGHEHALKTQKRYGTKTRPITHIDENKKWNNLLDFLQNRYKMPPMSNLSGSNQPPIPPDDAENLLNRLFNDFWMIVGAAWQSWENLPALERMKLDARARAACINRFIVFEAKLHFSKVNGVNVVERRGMFLLSVEGRVLLRFKKLREDKKTSNVPTRQQKLFSTHKELPEMPPHAAYLTVGYMLNITETGIEAVLVTCQNGSQ